jgi:hypothetical protein
MAIGSIHGWHRRRAVGISGNDAASEWVRHLPDRCCCKGRADRPTLIEIRFDDASKSAGVGAPAEIGAPPAGGVAALGIVEAMASRQSIHQD